MVASDLRKEADIPCELGDYKAEKLEGEDKTLEGEESGLGAEDVWTLRCWGTRSCRSCNIGG